MQPFLSVQSSGQLATSSSSLQTPSPHAGLVGHAAQATRSATRAPAAASNAVSTAAPAAVTDATSGLVLGRARAVSSASCSCVAPETPHESRVSAVAYEPSGRAMRTGW